MSTWARQNFSSVPTFDLLDESLFQDYLCDPRRRESEYRSY
jgi:hypothetical protein